MRTISNKEAFLLASIIITLAGCSGEAPEPTIPFEPFPAPFYLVNSVSFSPSGDTIYVALLHREIVGAADSTNSNQRPEVAIYEAYRSPEGWSNPVLVPFSGSFEDYEPTVSPDGERLVFNTKRPGSDTSRVPLERNDLWRVERTADGWGEPQHIATINTTDWTEAYASMTSDGTLYLLSDRPRAGQAGGGANSADIYRSAFVNGTYSSPALVEPISTELGEGDAWVAPDGSYLIFTRFDAEVGWEETCDLYISFSSSSGWSKAVPLETLNTAGPDFSVAISPDAEWLYYRANYAFVRQPFGPVLDAARKAAGVPESAR